MWRYCASCVKPFLLPQTVPLLQCVRRFLGAHIAKAAFIPRGALINGYFCGLDRRFPIRLFFATPDFVALFNLWLQVIWSFWFLQSEFEVTWI
jgi:hypothetical protein